MAQSEAIERPPLTDEVEVILRRIIPGEMEKEELLAESGLETDELRDVLAYLEAEGHLDPEAEHVRWRDGDGALTDTGGGVPPEPPDDDEAETQVHELPASGGLPVRLSIAAAVTFGRQPGESDDAVGRKAQAVLDEIRVAISERMPNLDCSVTVERIEAYDSPRTIWPPEDDAA